MQPIKEGLLWSSNMLLYSFLWPSARTTRVRWVEPHGELLDIVRSERKVVFIALHRYGYALYLSFGENVPEALRPAVVGHDGALSRCQSRAGQWLGYPIFEFQRGANESPRSQVSKFLIDAPQPLALLPDSGGPYGLMKPGILEIAKRSDAFLVPLAVDCTHHIEVGARLRHVIPLPCGEISVLRSTPLDARDVSLEDCQQALDQLELRVAERKQIRKSKPSQAMARSVD